MKVFLAIKYYADHHNRTHIEQISSALERDGLETICIARNTELWGQVKFSAEELMERSFAEIDSSGGVVVDLTEKGVGLGIEAGYAYAKGIPIVIIARNGADISTTLQGIARKLVLYDTVDDLERARLEAFFSQQAHVAKGSRG